MAAETLPFGKKIIYALGQFGWSLASFGVVNLINYFYAAPGTGAGAGGGATEAAAEAAEAAGTYLFPSFIPYGAVLGIFTIVGLLNAVFRLFDGVTDPVIAGASDRSRSRIGRRKIFMASAAAPFAVLSVLVFIPPVREETAANAVWLAVMLALFYIAMTAYVVPYTALISEYGHSSTERLNLSTMISITFALGALVGNLVYTLRPMFEPLFGTVGAFQVVLAIFATVSLVLMYLPVLFIDERRYAEGGTSNQTAFAAFFSTFRNRDFRYFALSDFMYWLALTFIQTGIAYYVITLLGMPEAVTSALLVALFLLSFAFYVPVNLIAKRVGKKRLLAVAFIVFAGVFVLVTFFGTLPLPPAVQAWAVVVLAAFPLSTFSILPNAVIADVADAESRTTGSHKAAAFFGARGLMMKLGIAMANLIFPSLLLLGRTVENSLGVRLTGVVAGAFLVLGLLLLLGYREDRVNGIIAGGTP